MKTLKLASSLFIINLFFSVFLNSAIAKNNDLSRHAQANKTPIILISIDGFAQNYLTQYPTPNLQRLMKKSVVAKALLPVYPSKTFPNHLSIITGVYPNKHGIIHNKFYDRELKDYYHLGAGKDQPKWLKAKPIWTRAEQKGIKSAIYFWPESEAKVQGDLPTYIMPYKKSTPNLTRINKVLSWLSLPIQERPQFVASYFSIVDTAGHKYGRNSPELANAVQKIDELIGILETKLEHQLGNNFDLIIVSDHGMVQLQANSAIDWQDKVIKSTAATIVNGETQLLIYSPNALETNTLKQHFIANAKGKYEVFSQGNFPKHWHWQTSTARTPDLIINANIPFVFKHQHGTLNKGEHGFDASNNDDLQAIFIAHGKHFKTGETMPAFQNVNVAPLILHLLNINDATDLDGTFSLFLPYLK